jgi:hypothetical protein
MPGRLWPGSSLSQPTNRFARVVMAPTQRGYPPRAPTTSRRTTAPLRATSGTLERQCRFMACANTSRPESA